jgi:parallel beta-helix repeat protein
MATEMPVQNKNMTDFIRALRRTIVGALVMGVFVVVSILAPKAQATTGINQQVNFQGRLLTSQGATVPDGYYNIQFKIYQDGTGTVAGNPSGTLKWTESWLNNDAHGVQVKNGYMSVQLGSITSLSSVDWNQDTLWLSINIGNTNTTCTPFTSCSGDGEMLPMKRLSSTPYSLNSGMLGGLTSAQFLQLAQGVQTEAGTNTTSIAINKTGTGGNFLNLQANSVDVFNITNTGDINFGSSIDHAISVSTAAASTAGKALTISAGTAGTGATALTGGTLTLQGGNGGGTGGNGGNLVLDAGAAASGGTGGTITIGGTNASSISLGQNTTLSSGKSLTISGGTTANRPSSPTEGMMWYDTDTKQLLIYSNGKWQADRSTATKIVAASNASQALKDSADYVATGTGDQAVVNNALTAAAGGKVYLTEGTYTINASISIPDNTTLAGAGQGTIIAAANMSGGNLSMIINTNQSSGNPGTNVIVQDMTLNGRSDINTTGAQYGVLLHNIGTAMQSGISDRSGATVRNVQFISFRTDALKIQGAANSTFINNKMYGVSGNGSSGIYAQYLYYSTIADNMITGNYWGLRLSGAADNAISGNVFSGSLNSAIISDGNSNANTITTNSFVGNAMDIAFNATTGSVISANSFNESSWQTIVLDSASSSNTVAGNNFREPSGNTHTNAVIVTNDSDNNSITGNTVIDAVISGDTNSGCSIDCYAISIVNANVNGTYLAANTLGSGISINDVGTGTVYGGQVNAAGNYIIQPAGTIELLKNTNVTGTLSASTSVLTPNLDRSSAGTLTIGTNATNTTALTIGSASVTTTIQGNTGVTLNTTSGTASVCRNTSGVLSICDASYLAPTATNFIQNGTSQQASANFNISGTGVASTLQASTSVLTPLVDTASADTLAIGTTNATAISLNQNVTVASGKSLTLAGGTTANRPASPTEGMMWYDTTTKQLLIYSNGKWQADKSDAVLVAAANSSQTDKDAANYVGDGNTATANDGDQVQINTALTAAAGKKVVLLPGTYVADATISIPNNTTLAGVGQGTIIQLADIDATDNLIENTDQTTGTGITIRDLKLDGQDTLNTGSINQRGIYLNNMGDYSTGSTGATITGLRVENFHDAGIYMISSDNNIASNTTIYGMDAGSAPVGIYVDSSRNNTITGNVISANYWGVRLDGSSTTANSITGNSFRGGQRGVFAYAAVSNTITGNSFDTTTDAAVNLYQGSNNTVSGNTFTNNTNYGVLIDASGTNTVSGNNLMNSGGPTNNNAIYLQGNGDGNLITNNTITDTSATTNYAINISAATNDATYLANNTLGAGTINDVGTGTIYGGQSNGTSYLIQPATSITLGSGTTTTTIQGSLSITPQTSTSTTLLCTNSGVVSTCDSTVLAPTATNFIRNGTTQQTSSNFNISGTGVASTLQAATFDTTGSATLNIGTGNASALTLGKAGVATTTAGGLLTNSIDATSATTLTIGGNTASAVSVGKAAGTINLLANSTLVGTSGGTITIQGAAQATSNTNGNLFTLQGSTGNGTASGGRLTLQGGTAGATSGNGGDVYVTGGTATGTGATGLVLINTPTYQTATTDSACYTGGNNVAASCTISSASVNGNGAIIVGFSAVGQTATLPDPVNTVTSATGRVIYITASGTSQDFTLKANSGGGAGIEQNIAMRKNTTATMIWNGADWTAAGASSSTTLQAAYDNTLQSAGGAELVVSKTSATNGLTIRDSTTNSVNGALLNVQSSSAANLFSVNSNVTEYATDAGAEVYGASTTTFPASTWATVASPASTVTRYTTAGDYIATGQGSVSVTTPATANAGVINTLSTSLTANMTYNVSFSARLATGTFTDMTVYYSINGTTQSVLCAAGQTAKTSIWTKINCTFQAPSTGITATNAILIQQATGVLRTFYVDNLSVTIAANYNYAADPGVDDTGMANWSAAGTASVVQNPSDGYDASSSAQVTTSTASSGVRNKLSINPLLSTLYRVSIYAKLNSGTALTDFTVRYTPNGGANFVSCVDYSTQTLTSGWAQITCYIKTDTTALGTPYVYFTQATASGTRIFSVDTFSMTLAASTTPNVQVGSGSNGGPTTLLTLDKGASAPIAANNDALLGSMYYDTTLGKLQCYEADGWGACGSSPDNIITISPEYTNAVMHGTGIGTMISDFCSDTLGINNSTNPPAVCGTNETYNFYRWTSPQASEQAYSIYVTYQLPNTFKSFASGQTSLQARVDSTSNAYVKLQIYKNHSGLSPCGTNVTITTAVNTWQYPAAAGTADPSTCGFVGGDSIVFKITMGAWSNANAYVGNLNFTFSNK